VTRNFLRVVEKVQEFKRKNVEPATFQQELQKDGLGLALLLMGAGGTGKSAVVHELNARLKAKGLHLLVTAYTGVASAPFGGPTLLSLLNLCPSMQKRNVVRDLSQTQIQETKQKFKSESGMDIRDVGGIVIDEISFIEARLFGHADGILRQCTDNDAPFGGIPVLLAGGNMQKEPPNSQGGPWFKGLVDRASGDLTEIRPETAEAKGLDLELELELILSQMAQKPMLRGEVGATSLPACRCTSSNDSCAR